MSGWQGLSATDKNTMVFVVREGTVTVLINTTEFIATRGDSFFVPPHNTYNLLNKSQQKAELFIVQYKYDGSINPESGS